MRIFFSFSSFCSCSLIQIVWAYFFSYSLHSRALSSSFSLFLSLILSFTHPLSLVFLSLPLFPISLPHVDLRCGFSNLAHSRICVYGEIGNNCVNEIYVRPILIWMPRSGSFAPHIFARLLLFFVAICFFIYACG